MTKAFKAELLRFLTPFFGEQFVRNLDKLYDEGEDQAIFEVGHKLLAGYLGGSSADTIMSRLAKKHKLRVKLVKAS